MHRGHLVGGAIVASTVLAVAGCGTIRTVTGPVVTTTTTTTRSSGPTTTVTKQYRTYHVGQTATVTNSGAGLRVAVTVATPRVSHTRLSSSYGFAPAHGTYLTFPLRIVNSGSSPVKIARLDFVLSSPGLGHVTTNEGNTPYSGAGRQLDTTVIPPGGAISNALTFDVRSSSGTLRFEPSGRVAAAWRL